MEAASSLHTIIDTDLSSTIRNCGLVAAVLRIVLVIVVVIMLVLMLVGVVGTTGLASCSLVLICYLVVAHLTFS